MKHRRHRQRLTEAQMLAMIPAGAVPPIRMDRDAIEIEEAAVADSGRIMVMRQVVSTPIRKLLQQGAITAIEADAAGLLRADHDAAYARSKSILASVQVDGGSRGGGDEARMARSMRYRKAMFALCPELRRVAFLGLVGGGCDTGSYVGIGKALLPSAGLSEATGAGKSALVIVCRELAVFYGMRRAA